MTSWRKTAFCSTCVAPRPYRRSKVKGERWVCLECGDPVMLPSKHNNVPVVSKHTGRIIQSKKEAAWEPTLLALENVGEIRDLVPQGPTYKFQVYSNGPVEALIEAAVRIGVDREALFPITEMDRALLLALVRDVYRSVVNIPGTYRPDWTFTDKDGNFHVHDVKGRAFPKYRRDKALMLACYGLIVEEPEPYGVQQRARGAGIRGRGTGSRLSGNGA